MQRRDVGSVVLPSVHEFSSRARARARRHAGADSVSRSRIIRSTLRRVAGACNFREASASWMSGRGKERRRGETARSKTREEEAAGRGEWEGGV